MMECEYQMSYLLLSLSITNFFKWATLFFWLGLRSWDFICFLFTHYQAIVYWHLKDGTVAESVCNIMLSSIGTIFFSCHLQELYLHELFFWRVMFKQERSKEGWVFENREKL